MNVHSFSDLIDMTPLSSDEVFNFNTVGRTTSPSKKAKIKVTARVFDGDYLRLFFSKSDIEISGRSEKKLDGL